MEDDKKKKRGAEGGQGKSEILPEQYEMMGRIFSLMEKNVGIYFDFLNLSQQIEMVRPIEGTIPPISRILLILRLIIREQEVIFEKYEDWPKMRIDYDRFRELVAKFYQPQNLNHDREILNDPDLKSQIKYIQGSFLPPYKK